MPDQKVGRIEFGPVVSRSELFRLHAQGVPLMKATGVHDELGALADEVARLREALADVLAWIDEVGAEAKRRDTERLAPARLLVGKRNA